MQVTGIIKLINEIQKFESGFRKRELVLTTEEQYPQHLLIEFIQDRCDLLDSFEVGQKVTISINLRGREWTNPEGIVKYFNSIQGWRIEQFNQDVPQQPTPTEQVNSLSGDVPPAGFTPQNVPTTEKTAPESQEEDDLPF